MFHRSILLLTAVSVLAVGAAQAATSTDVIAGRRIAQENCGGCHAIGPGRSPSPAAPPFRNLYHRYRPGGLNRLLQEGMLADTSQEEGSIALHPRMPSRRLDPDQVASLKAFLHSLDPRRSRR
jgi:mono/diheme cytochrome c family protein